jgi:hypothetical protein
MHALDTVEGNEAPPKRIYEKMIELYPELREKKNLRAAVRIRLQEWSSDSRAWQERRPWKQRLDIFEQVGDGLWRIRAGSPTSAKMAEFPSPEAEGGYVAYDPSTVDDAREKVLSLMTARLGQRAFRNKLVINYENACAISRCRTGYVLEAAHVTPYIGVKSNVLPNGILLRSDIHTLYDLGLLAINPDSHAVELNERLTSEGSDYAVFQGETIFKAKIPPSKSALQVQYEFFQSCKEVYD